LFTTCEFFMSAHPGFNALVGAFLACVIASTPNDGRVGHPSRATSSEVIVFNDNGAWSWFEDERAVVDQATGTLLVSSVADADGTGGADRDGNVEIASYELATGTVTRTVLHPHLEADDHDSAALYVRPDGRYVAMYSSHVSDPYSRWRISRNPGNIATWEPEAMIDNGAPASYSNLYATADDLGTGALYAFVRTFGRDPHLLRSWDHGATWSRSGRLLDGPGRPYVRYAADGAGRIHLITTEQHPDDYANGIYHGVIADGQLVRSDGAVVDSDLTDGDAVSPERLTKVFAGTAADHAWSIDVQLDRHGLPYIAFSVHTQPSAGLGDAMETDGRYYYARFDGATWHVHAVASAGSALSRDEPFYTGLVALDPHDPDRLFISTDVDPRSGRPLVSGRDGRRHHELFEGKSADGGAAWSWAAVTADSTVDNIRPIVPTWDSQHTALLWLRGRYTTYKDYDLDVVGIVFDHDASVTRAR
jgi:hypothetical protein